MHTPRHDSVYIGYLESYAQDSLPSCKVIHKKHSEGEYSTAVYHLDSLDFRKVLEGILSEKYLDQPPLDSLNVKAKELIYKEDCQHASDLDYFYTLYHNREQIGFKPPDLIIYYRKLSD